MPNLLQRGASNQGFTLVEMVITVAVMAILVSLSMPAIFEYMRQRDAQNEEITMNEIRKAMQAYLADTGTLPDDTGTGNSKWSHLLAGYTSLAENQIENDVWGRPRTYIRYENTTRNMFGTPVSVYYVSLHSAGVNGKAENTFTDTTGSNKSIDGIALAGNSFAASTNNSWWRNKTTPDNVVTAYSSLRAGGDDKILRYTNYSDVLDRYNMTIQRLDRITQALETYARSGYAERVSECSTSTDPKCQNGIPERTIYYPRSVPTSANTENVSISGSGSNAWYSSTTIVVTGQSNDTTRRDGMESLVNLLGLPAEFCCSALENGTDAKPKPFYYFSNPRPRTSSGGCAARPVVVPGTPASDTPKLPARLTTKNDSSTCG